MGGFAACLGVGVLLEICSFGMLSSLLSGKAGRYACIYTLGNIIALSGTMFLAGPHRQCKRMMMEKRWVASLVFVCSMAATLLLAVLQNFPCRGLLILVLVVMQWCALIWYTLSYIPFG